MIFASKGFSLIELLIVIAIVSILTLIAVPTYQQYTRKAYYTEIVNATQPYKLGVMECYQELGTLDTCNEGSNNIPPAISTPISGIKSIHVAGGKITAIPMPLHGLLEGDDYLLTPQIQTNMVIWQSSGGGVSKGYAK